jgi:hypothetical protein
MKMLPRGPSLPYEAMAQGANFSSCASMPTKIYIGGGLGWQSIDLDGLGIKEVVGDFTVRQLGVTCFQESKPIDGIRATRDLTMANACVMPVEFGVGNHQLFVIDFVTPRWLVLACNQLSVQLYAA